MFNSHEIIYNLKMKPIELNLSFGWIPPLTAVGHGLYSNMFCAWGFCLGCRRQKGSQRVLSTSLTTSNDCRFITTVKQYCRADSGNLTDSLPEVLIDWDKGCRAAIADTRMLTSLFLYLVWFDYPSATCRVFMHWDLISEHRGNQASLSSPERLE